MLPTVGQSQLRGSNVVVVGSEQARATEYILGFERQQIPNIRNVRNGEYGEVK